MYNMVCTCVCVGLLCGDLVPSRDGCSGSESPSRSFVGPESHLPAGVCPQRPGPDESQVSHFNSNKKSGIKSIGL